MTDLLRKVTFGRTKLKELPAFTPGDTVGVYVKVKEGEKERVQLFRGVVIKIQGKGLGRSFTVRKISCGVGVERTFPFASPAIERVELVSTGRVRRGKLFYLRKLKGRAARLVAESARDAKRFAVVEEGEAIGAADEVVEPTPVAPAEPEKKTTTT